MALEPRDLIYPRGVVKPAHFPGEVLIRTAPGDEPGTVDVWLAQAVDLTQDEDAQRAFVYTKAYTAIADRLALEYSSESMGRRSKSRASYQIAHFQRLAAVQTALFERKTGTSLPKASPQSGSTHIEASF